MSKLNLPEWAQKIKFKEDEVKIIKWVQSLNFNQRNYMKKVIEDAAAALADDEAKKKFADVLDWLGLAMSAQLIDRFDTSISENGKIYEEILDDVSDCMKMLKRIKGKKEMKLEELKMAVKKLEEELILKAKEYIKGDAYNTPKEIKNQLAYDFPKANKSLITTTFKKAKEEIAVEKTAEIVKPEMTAEEEAIMDIICPEEKEPVEVKQSNKDKPVKEEVKKKKIEFNVDMTPKATPSKLKVKSKVIEVEGEFGDYKIENDVLKCSNGRTFRDIEDVQKWKEETIKNIESQADELIEVCFMM